METTNKKYFTVSKANVFSVTLGKVVFSVEASSLMHRVVTFETDTLKLQNVENLKEHPTLEDAHSYIKSLTQLA